MKDADTITDEEYEYFNENVRRLPRHEVEKFLWRFARVTSDRPCNPEILAELTKWLCRKVRGRDFSKSQVAADAAAVMRLAMRARRAVAFGRSPADEFDTAATILAKYRTEVVRRADPFGMTMGVKFTDGAYRRDSIFGPDSKHDNVFFLA